jgi:hypothetical protein
MNCPAGHVQANHDVSGHCPEDVNPSLLIGTAGFIMKCRIYKDKRTWSGTYGEKERQEKNEG